MDGAIVKYLIAGIVALAAFVAATIQPDQSLTIFGFAGATIAAVLAAGFSAEAKAQAKETKVAVEETHKLVNSQTSALLAEVKKSSFAAGKLEGPNSRR